MRGAFEKLKDLWPSWIKHNHKEGTAKEVRYQVREERLELLREHAENFAYKYTKEGQQVAYLHRIEEEDLDYRMPKSARYEYICGNLTSEECILFSYLWFDSLDDAKSYVEETHAMNLVGGWADEN